jgi:hypothetical protein
MFVVQDVSVGTCGAVNAKKKIPAGAGIKSFGLLACD